MIGRHSILLAASLLLAPSLRAATSEITIDFKLDHHEFVINERVRGVLDIMNVSPDVLSEGLIDSQDRVFIEVYRSHDRSQLEKISKGAFVSAFVIKPNEGQKFEVYLGDHYGLGYNGRYLAKPVLVHDGTRYEGKSVAFDIVPGMKIGGALQLFANHDDFRREFELAVWRRGDTEHLFLKAKDLGEAEWNWRTIDLGSMMKITKPTLSILKTGEIIVLHRFDSDYFVRSDLWSVPQGIEYINHELVRDPETAASERIRELYQESGGVKPESHAWWEFWK